MLELPPLTNWTGKLSLKFINYAQSSTNEDQNGSALSLDRAGCFVYFDDQLVDCLMISKKGKNKIQPDSLSININEASLKKGKLTRMVLIVKDIEKDLPYIGSVSVSAKSLMSMAFNKTHQVKLPLYDQ